ncbi:hypothetical protein APHAL10511_000573 [Amanita phalloides]|nr:hypothetical protein APHAL10511_000573 [Amanita phalloides]
MKLTRRLLSGRSTVADLQAAFRDPNSPFYIPPGSTGPASPDDTIETNAQNSESRKAHSMFLREGFDPHSFWEQKIAWGDQDSFQHVNNVRYVQFFESSRIQWMTSLGVELGGPQRAQDMIKAKGVSLILKSIAVQFRRPVTYPDTLLIGYRPIAPSVEDDPAALPVMAKAYSLAQQAFVANSNEVLVWYDYDKLKKCDPGNRINNNRSTLSMSTIVKVFVVSPDTRSERRLDLNLSVEQLKNKLEPITGIPAGNQIITLFDSESSLKATSILNDDTKQLGFYGLRDWQVLEIADSNPSVSLTGQLNDVSQVEKFELSAAEYEKRADSVLAYKRVHRVGRFAPQDEEKQTEPKLPTKITVGARCEVESSEEGLHKRGTIRYVGETKFSKGMWIGVEYDEPMGKNDGSVQGEQYFTCNPNYGVFVRPDKVKIGEYPVLELDLEDEEM